MLLKILILTAAFEARDAVIIGKEVFQETDNWREPIANYVIESNADIDIQAGHHITLKPGTSLKAGSRCRLHIQNDFVCTQAVFRPVATTEQIPEIVPYTEQYVKTFLPEKKETINQTKRIDVVINVFPNPSADGLFTLQINNAQNIKYKIEVADMLGKQVFTTEIKENNSVINLQEFGNGMYIIKITNDENTYIKKVLVQ